MERKIGEIFNYQDNWYQCIENTGYGCIICHFNTHNNICCSNVIYSSKEEALNISKQSLNISKQSEEHITTIKIEWEE